MSCLAVVYPLFFISQPRVDATPGTHMMDVFARSVLWRKASHFLDPGPTFLGGPFWFSSLAFFCLAYKSYNSLARVIPSLFKSKPKRKPQPGTDVAGREYKSAFFTYLSYFLVCINFSNLTPF